MFPEEHTILCLVNPPQCQESYEILGEPDTAGEPYQRVAKLDDFGRDLLVQHAREVGSGCNGCVGDLEQGLEATLLGTYYDTTTDPPLFNVTSLVPGNVGCGHTTMGTVRAASCSKKLP